MKQNITLSSVNPFPRRQFRRWFGTSAYFAGQEQRTIYVRGWGSGYLDMASVAGSDLFTVGIKKKFQSSVVTNMSVDYDITHFV